MVAVEIPILRDYTLVEGRTERVRPPKTAHLCGDAPARHCAELHGGVDGKEGRLDTGRALMAENWGEIVWCFRKKLKWA